MKRKAGSIVYRGSVKNLISLVPPTPSRAGTCLFEFTDDYSVFDYGKMPDRLRGKGQAMALMSAWLFERISDPAEWKSLARSPVWEEIAIPAFRDRLRSSPVWRRFRAGGAPTHYRGILNAQGKRVRTSALTSPSRHIEVTSVQILQPDHGTVEGASVWDYNRFHPETDNFLIPLEVVFRFGTPRGSSLLERVHENPGYLAALGLTKIGEGKWLERPVTECFSKLEPSDRILSPEMAVNFSGLSLSEFQEVIDTTLLLAIFLQDRFSRAGIELWDGKFEFLRARRRLLAGDAITPDELRLVRDGIQISKEPVRQYYRRRHPEFLARISEAKVLATRKGKKIGAVLKSQGYRPPGLDPEFRRAMEDMYLGLTAELTGLAVLPPHRPLSEVLAVIRKWVE